jgi:hypothetical protein
MPAGRLAAFTGQATRKRCQLPIGLREDREMPVMRHDAVNRDARRIELHVLRASLISKIPMSYTAVMEEMIPRCR